MKKITGCLREKNTYYHTCISLPREEGGTFRKWQTTGVKIAGKTKRERTENRRKAERILVERLKTYEESYTLYSDKLFLTCIEDWLKHIHFSVRQNTWDGYDIHYRTHIKPFFSQRKYAKLRISEVMPAHIQAYIDAMCREGQSPNSIKHHMRVLNGTFKEALRLNLIAYNPCERVVRPKLTKPVSKAYTPQQARDLLQVIDDEPIKPAIMLGLYLGLRRSEVLGLRWKDIDFDQNMVHIRNTVTFMRTRIETEQTKSSASCRDLPLMESLKTYLLSIREHQEEMKQLMGNCYHETGHVCCREDGSDFPPDYITCQFKKILAKNHLPPIRFHELRHTAGSLLINAGADVKRVQEFLGHEDVSTTLNIYTHLTLETRRATSDMMDSILSGEKSVEMANA